MMMILCGMWDSEHMFYLSQSSMVLQGAIMSTTSTDDIEMRVCKVPMKLSPLKGLIYNVR